MPLSRRYTPELAPGESSVFGMDFSYVIPPGVGIASATLQLIDNAPDALPITSITAGPVSVKGRTVYSTLTVVEPTVAAGHDCQLIWTVTDTDGNIWPRTALVLCAATS